MKEQYKGWMQTTFKAPYDLSNVQPSRGWIENLLRQNPDLTGWPFFVDLWTPRNPDQKPKIVNGVWEAKLVSIGDGLFDGIDHWRIDGKRGLFYAARVLEDDISRSNSEKGKTLDFGLAILRTAEVIAIAIRFVNFVGSDVETESLTFPLNIKWIGLQDRVISSWANPGRGLYGTYPCNSDSVSKTVDVPLAGTHDQISLLTQKIVGELFLQFDGWSCSTSVIEDLVGRLLNRKL